MNHGILLSKQASIRFSSPQKHYIKRNWLTENEDIVYNSCRLHLNQVWNEYLKIWVKSDGFYDLPDPKPRQHWLWMYQSHGEATAKWNKTSWPKGNIIWTFDIHTCILKFIRTKLHNIVTSYPTPSIHPMVFITMPAARDSALPLNCLSSIWASSFTRTLYNSTLLLQRTMKLPVHQVSANWLKILGHKKVYWRERAQIAYLGVACPKK